MKVCTAPMFGALFLFSVMSTTVDGACLSEKGTHQITLGVSPTTSPYVLSETHSGIGIDVIREALALQDYDLCPIYLPGSRAAQHFAQGRLDGLVNVRTPHQGGYVADTSITLRNCAFSLAESGLKLTGIEDLAGQAVAAFQRASILLDSAFALTINQMPSYQEVHDQYLQLHLLFRGRVDVIVLEERIFNYYYRKILDGKGSTPVVSAQIEHNEVRKSCIFEPLPYRVAFADKSVRDAFTAGIKALKASGRYDEIIDKYSH